MSAQLHSELALHVVLKIQADCKPGVLEILISRLVQTRCPQPGASTVQPGISTSHMLEEWFLLSVFTVRPSFKCFLTATISCVPPCGAPALDSPFLTCCITLRAPFRAAGVRVILTCCITSHAPLYTAGIHPFFPSASHCALPAVPQAGLPPPAQV